MFSPSFKGSASGSSVSRRAFFPRFIGLGVGFFCVAAVFAEAPGTPLWLWSLLIAFCYLWPVLALWVGRRSVDPMKAERRHVLFDSVMGGFWIAAIDFNTLPAVVMFSMLAMNNSAAGGARFVARGLLAQAGGMLLAFALLGFGFAPHTSQLQIYACIPMLVVHPLVIGTVLYRLAMQLAQHKQSLRELSRIDGLTGLFNRRYWDDLLRLEFAQRQADGGAASLALIDVDHFKGINDRHGHVLGDLVLRQVGQCIERNLRAADLPARYGGDEFCILLPGVTADQAVEILARLRHEIAALAFASAPQLSASLSVGVAAFDPSMGSATDWLEAADRALYSAKHQGRDRICVERALLLPEALPTAC